MSLNQIEQEILERKIAHWLYEQGRRVTAKAVSGHFKLHVQTARIIIHRIMRRTDGTCCQLLGANEQTPKGHRQVKYFSVIHLPEEILSYDRYTDNTNIIFL